MRADVGQVVGWVDRCALALVLGCSLHAPQLHAQGSDLTACDAAEPFDLLSTPAPPLDARAAWIDTARLYWTGTAQGATLALHHAESGGMRIQIGQTVQGADRRIPLRFASGGLTADESRRFGYMGAGVVLERADAGGPTIDALLIGEVVLVREDAQGRVADATRIQPAGALDARYAAAAETMELGAIVDGDITRFALWAPSANAVDLCVYRDSTTPAAARLPMQRDAASGVFSIDTEAAPHGSYYRFLVEVFQPGIGRVRQRVTDPYSFSLSANGARSMAVDPSHPTVTPTGWAGHDRPSATLANTDLAIYELHVRDFSVSDRSVPAEQRGTYLAFTTPDTQGMRHLRRLARAGISDIHLLPAFDFATVPEIGCVGIRPKGGPNDIAQQAAISAQKQADCFNWGYDPAHFNAPEGSYASNALDGAVRVREFRAMVQGLHALGLRVGMDVVYNHMSASGAYPPSILDRIVPAYYHRLDSRGGVTTSTCCANTATEHRMMAKLMIDSTVHWVRHYAIESFRFDLMGHQPRAAMERLQSAVDEAAGRRIHLLGEGWNFGEVENGARFEQASQLSLGGSGIATFSDRGRDAARGGGCCDSGESVLINQGVLNGLFLAPNARSAGRFNRDDLLRSMDQLRIALAGTIRDMPIPNRFGVTVDSDVIEYAGQPAGYAEDPGEVVNYVENHDNPTLFDINVYKLPQTASMEHRVRAQMLGAALVALSQGIAYFHAGQDILRSKSLDRNSYDSGDWFNLLDWSYQDNGFGRGLPIEQDNGVMWPFARPLLGDAAIKPSPDWIGWSRDAFRDLIRIRRSSGLFRLGDADAVRGRLAFANTGPDQVAGVLAAHLDGRGLEDAGFDRILFALNFDLAERSIAVPDLAGAALVLHPLQASRKATDPRPREQSSWQAGSGTLRVPALSAVVYVLPAP